MSFTLKNGQGTLHRNDKGGVETRPDYRGQLALNGATYEIAGWLKEGPKGKWMSLSVKLAQEQPSPGPNRADPATVDDDIPF